MEVYETLRQFVVENLLPDRAVTLQADTPLDSLGIVDSLSVLKLVSFLEEHFGIVFEAADIDSGSFSSLAGIERLVRTKIATHT